MLHVHHTKSLATWAAVLVVALVGIAEASWQTAGLGKATAGTAGSSGLDDKFTSSWDPGSNGYKAMLAMQFKCDPCPTCPPGNLPQVNFEYVIHWYSGTTYLGTTETSSTQHQCQCPTTLISVTSGSLLFSPSSAVCYPTVMCSCCNGSTVVWTEDDRELMGNLVPGVIDLTRAN